MSKVRNPFYICTDCDVTFELLTWPKANKRKKYCPMCGDDFAVKAFRPKGNNKKTLWTDEEIALLDDCIAGKISSYAVAHKIDRKMSTVDARITRRRQELGTVLVKRPSWTDEGKILAEKCVDGELTIEEVMAATGKSFESVRVFVSRIRVKRRKDNESNHKRPN